MYKLGSELNPWKTHIFGKRNAAQESSSTVIGKGSSKGWRVKKPEMKLNKKPRL